MSSGEARELRFELAVALGLRPQSSENKGGWNYQQTVWVKTTTTALSDSCSTVRLEGHFRYGWQHHILLNGTFCLEDAGTAWWSARAWKIDYLPGLPPGYADITTDGTFFPCERPSGVDSVYQGGELPAVLRDKFAGVAAMPRLYFGSTGFDFIWHSGKRWVLLYLQGAPVRGSLQVFDVSDDGQRATIVPVTPEKNGALCIQAQKYAHS